MSMSKKTILIPVGILAAALVLLLTITGQWNKWVGDSADQKTDDATLRADVTPLSTRVSGTVKRVDVSDYQRVKAGQTLIELEDADYNAARTEAEAALAGAEAEWRTNQDAKHIEDEKIVATATAVQQAQAAVDAGEAGVASSAGDDERAATDRKRQEALLAVKATTRQQYDAAVADSTRFAGMLSARQADVARAQAALAQARAALLAEQRQRAAMDTKDSVYRAQVEARKAAITVATVNFGYTKITAPTDGAVGERHVRIGQLVPAGMQVIDVVDSDPWVQANFKETQLARIRVGDPADIQVDSIPGHIFHGHVASLAPASGSQFALLPPDNATGNYTKVVQRVPVKIEFDPGDRPEDRLIPGLSVVVTVHTSERKGR
jgi:membrane fusion protein (multidrug efflux system)